MTTMITNRFLKSRTLVPLAVVVFALVLTACADVQVTTSECEDGGELWSEYRLFMGRGDGDREVVTDEDWNAFLADTITPRFPDGLSVFDIAGQGTNADGTLEQERTKMLLVLAPQGGDSLDKMNEISDEYKQRFSQSSTLRVITEACVAFK
ncbi:MAG: DUF3574 domain-containing protein [Rhodospirillaceae bacterium]|nr:DUF3574 domain-containing protein [Rhodospirillaceae bacterium]